jgi:hypothetical protein
VEAIIGMYTRAEMEYKAADSTIISMALRGWGVVPGMRDITNIRATMRRVQSTVVPTESETALIFTGTLMALKSCGIKSSTN